MRKLYRDPKDKIICGVCSGLGKYLGIDPVIIRLAAVALLVVNPALAIILYLAACVLIPEGKPGEIPIEEARGEIIPKTIEQDLVKAAKVILVIVGIIMIGYGVAIIAGFLLQPIIAGLIGLFKGIISLEAFYRIMSGLLMIFIGIIIIAFAIKIAEEHKTHK